MKEKLNISIVLAILLLIISGCSAINTSSPLTNNEITSSNEVSTLTNEFSTSTNTQIVSAQNDIPLSVTYREYQEQYRFIGKTAPVLWMPCESSPKVIDLTNTLVEVLFAGYTADQNIWLFVTYKTYDTPTNNRGWILQSKTDKYTKENQKLVKDIIIPKGTPEADNNEDNVESYDQFGFIKKQEQDRVLVMFAGGKEVWYYKKDIKYPPLE
jgi:hypothetical protein